MIRLLLTRPRDASQRFLDSLPPETQRLVTPVISPLLDIEPLDVTPDCTNARGLIFTSANGVATAAALSAPTNVPCYCVGAETTRAATAAGWTATCAGRNADELVRRLTEQPPPGPLCHLAGQNRRGDIAARLTAAGIPTRAQAIYDQRLLPLTPEATQMLDGDAPALVVLFSPRTARQFADLHHGQAPLYIAALSDAVADEVSHLNYKVLSICTQPDAQSMVALVAELADGASRVERDRAAD